MSGDEHPARVQLGETCCSAQRICVSMHAHTYQGDMLILACWCSTFVLKGTSEDKRRSVIGFQSLTDEQMESSTSWWRWRKGLSDRVNPQPSVKDF